MGILEILTLVAKAVPSAISLIDQLHLMKNSKTPGVVQAVTDLLPIAAQLMQTFTLIKTQTEDQYPEVWRGIRDKYASASAKFDELNKP